METFPPTDISTWAELCATCLRAGRLCELEPLLAAAPLRVPPELVAFYTGHRALAQADYPAAARAFQRAARSAACPALAHTSGCWLAFAHAALGQYDLAAALLAEPPPADASPASQGVYWLAQGLLASYRTELASGQTALEQALTLAKQSQDHWLATLARIILASVYQLALQGWRTFAPLLDDVRPCMRRRAAEHPGADRLLAALDAGPVKPWPPAPPSARAPLTIHSFGTFRVLRDGEPVQVRRAGTRKALAALGILLLAGERGVESRDLVLLLWPGGAEAQQRSSLHSAISGLRAVLDDRDGSALEAAAGRYYLHLPQAGIWWDWAERRQRLQSGADCADLTGELDDGPGFLEGFFDLIPSPPDLPDALQRQWESLYEWLHELAEARAAEVSAWLAPEVCA